MLRILRWSIAYKPTTLQMEDGCGLRHLTAQRHLFIHGMQPRISRRRNMQRVGALGL